MDILISFLNSTSQTTALTVFFASLTGFYLLKVVVVNRLVAITSRTSNHWDDALVRTINTFSWPFYGILSVWIASRFFTLDEQTHYTIKVIGLITITFYTAKAISTLLVYTVSAFLEYKSEEGEFDPGVTNVVKFIVRVLVWTVAALLVIQNLGYNVTTLIGGLGIAGIAIGLAVQNILGDVLSYFSIYMDRPFKIGDFIIVDKDMGEVEKIGIKSTRLRTLEGQQLIISNQELTSTRINNYQRMKKRRIEFRIGLTYNTAHRKLEKIPKLIASIIDKVDLAQCDRVHFKSFGDSALIFEIVYFVDSADYNVYMDTQHEINMSITKEFSKEKIDMAFPTQTVHVHKA